jgi:hypothetical protein
VRKRLIIVLDVHEVDATRWDPDEVADALLTDDAEVLADLVEGQHYGQHAVDFTHVAASWIDGDPLRTVVADALEVVACAGDGAVADVVRAIAEHTWSTP